MRRAHGGDHPRRHLLAVHAQLRVHAGDDDVEVGEEVVVEIERAIEVDVDLHPVEDAERSELLVEHGDDADLLNQPLAVEAVGDGQPRRVVGEHDVLVAEGDRRSRHRLDRRSAVAPRRVGVAVAAERIQVALRPRA